MCRSAATERRTCFGVHSLKALHAIVRKEGGGSAHVIKVPLCLRSTGVFRAAEVSILARGSEVLHIGPEETIAFGHTASLREAVFHLGGLLLEAMGHLHHGLERFRWVVVKRRTAFVDGSQIVLRSVAVGTARAKDVFFQARCIAEL